MNPLRRVVRVRFQGNQSQKLKTFYELRNLQKFKSPQKKLEKDVRSGGNSESSANAETSGEIFQKGLMISNMSNATEFKSQKNWKLSTEFWQLRGYLDVFERKTLDL